MAYKHKNSDMIMLYITAENNVDPTLTFPPNTK